jgi:serine/threonine protein kinase
MTIATGTRLGSFEILGLLGAGGMGEVYRARDGRVDRLVALKVLPEELFEGEDRRQRFEREAKLLAALNHPSVAAIYSFEEIPGSPSSPARHVIAMELAEGEGLDRKISSGPLAIEESLSIARQIAEALEAAHEKGIVHRDLKPANVVVSDEGRVKLLDFGLAKAFENDSGSSPEISASPTLTARATAAGVILGTAAYMSPEQARGKPVDKRADVWAFGVVLFEMLTGKRLFQGETVSDTLAAVLRDPVDFGKLPPATPPSVKVLLERCLERDPKQRLQAIGESRIASKGRSPEAPACAPRARSRPRRRRVRAEPLSISRGPSPPRARPPRRRSRCAPALRRWPSCARRSRRRRGRTSGSSRTARGRRSFRRTAGRSRSRRSMRPGRSTST